MRNSWRKGPSLLHYSPFPQFPALQCSWKFSRKSFPRRRPSGSCGGFYFLYRDPRVILDIEIQFASCKDRKNLWGGSQALSINPVRPSLDTGQKAVRHKKGCDFAMSRCSSWRRPERYIGGCSVCGSKNDKPNAPEIKFVKAPP